MDQDHETVLAQLAELAKGKGARVRWERYGGDATLCVLRGETVIFIDPGLSARRQVKALASVLARYDWEDVFLLPRLRSLIEGRDRPKPDP